MKSEMDFDHPPADPLAVCKSWLNEAETLGLINPLACSLATIDPEGRPSSRTDEVTTTNSEWNLVCIDRHFGAINCVFADFSTVRRVGLKELWRFKWHRNFNLSNRWTQAGGVTPEQWPHWMRTFSD